MSIATELTNLNDNLLDAYTAINTKGGTVPDNKNTDNLATAINSIPAGAEDWGYIKYMNSDDEEVTVNLQNEVEYLKLSETIDDGIPLNINIQNQTINKGRITEVHFGKSCTFAPDNFMSINATSSNFMLNKIDGLENLVHIGSAFLYNNKNFNQNLSFPNLVEIGGYFMQNCISFTGDISFGKPVNIGRNFLSNLPSFNGAIDFSHIKTIGASFLFRCYAFNQPVDFSNSPIENIFGSFLYQCTSFNRPISFVGTSLTSIGQNFLYGCTSFDSSIDLGSVTLVGSGFLDGCTAFNSSLNLSNLQEYGQYFMRNCTSFNQNLTYPSSITRGSTTYFMYNCKSFTGNLVCESNNKPSGSQTLSTDDATAPMYTTGVTLTGTYASQWKSFLPDSSNSPYRKLIVGS